MAERTTRADVDRLAALVGGLVGLELTVERWAPGDGRARYRLESPVGRIPFGGRWYGLRDLRHGLDMVIDAFRLAGATGAWMPGRVQGVEGAAAGGGSSGPTAGTEEVPALALVGPEGCREAPAFRGSAHWNHWSRRPHYHVVAGPQAGRCLRTPYQEAAVRRLSAPG
jgi:hypothetical protein